MTEKREADELAPENKAPMEKVLPESPAPERQWRIMVVDDIKMNLKLAEVILRKNFNCRIQLADSGMVCLELLQQQQEDLILLDIAMPELDGIETLKLIRQMPKLQSLPVIFLTASTDPLNIVKASELRVADYICKPFHADDLVERVGRVLERTE